jgi:dihydrofolate synthase/folylpolyglutamate synthase
MNFKEIEKYLYSRIKDKIDIGYSAGFSLERVKYTLELLGNPQEKIIVIHIAGTSGKGSTASFISKILTAHGFKTGLTLSPHIHDIRERIQINNNLIEQEIFANNFTELLEIFKEVEKSKFGSLSYFEMIISLAYYTFWKENVDYAVIETGLGGTYDATNCISNTDKVCVITRIGYDHMKILGKSLEEIAKNKAGIIGRNQHVVFLSQPNTNPIFEEKIREMNSNNDEIKLEQIIEFYKNEFDINYKDIAISKIKLGNIPEYQIENYALSVATTLHLSQRDNWKITESILITTFEKFDFSGRFEIMESERVKYILDGAHNEQKMQAFISSLTSKYPSLKFTFVLAFKEDKDVFSMIKIIQPHAKNIFITNFNSNNQDITHKSFPSQEITDILSSLYFTEKVKIEANISNIIREIETQYGKSYEPIIVTGSLYLVSEFRKQLINKHQR